MTPGECYSTLTDAVQAKRNAITAREKLLSADEKTAKHTLAMEGGMYTLVLRACLLVGTAPDAQTVIRNHKTRLERIFAADETADNFPLRTKPPIALTKQWATLTDTEKDACAPYLFAVLFLQYKILADFGAQLAEARAHNATNDIIELNIKCGVLQDCMALLRQTAATLSLPDFEVCP